MDKIAAKAEALSRRIYASLPWGFRVAGLFLRLSYNAQETFGRFAYAKFVQAGVEGMPDINGKPALSMRGEVQGPRAEMKLPSGYGAKFGHKVWAVALSKLRNPELVEDAISAVTVKLVSGQMRIEEGAPLAKAEQLVIVSVLNAGRDAQRVKRRDRSDSMVDDMGVEMDISDPAAFKAIENVLSVQDIRKMIAELDRINPRMGEWIEAILEGRPKTELAAQWGVAPAAVTNFENRNMDKIKKVVMKYVQDAAA